MSKYTERHMLHAVSAVVRGMGNHTKQLEGLGVDDELQGRIAIAAAAIRDMRKENEKKNFKDYSRKENWFLGFLDGMMLAFEMAKDLHGGADPRDEAAVRFGEAMAVSGDDIDPHCVACRKPMEPQSPEEIAASRAKVLRHLRDTHAIPQYIPDEAVVMNATYLCEDCARHLDVEKL